MGDVSRAAFPAGSQAPETGRDREDQAGATGIRGAKKERLTPEGAAQDAAPREGTSCHSFFFLSLAQNKVQESVCEGPGLDQCPPGGEGERGPSGSWWEGPLGEGPWPKGHRAASEGSGSWAARNDPCPLRVTWDGITVSPGCHTKDPQLPWRARWARGTGWSFTEKTAPRTLDSKRNATRLYVQGYFFLQ